VVVGQDVLDLLVDFDRRNRDVVLQPLPDAGAIRFRAVRVLGREFFFFISGVGGMLEVLITSAMRWVEITIARNWGGALTRGRRRCLQSGSSRPPPRDVAVGGPAGTLAGAGRLLRRNHVRWRLRVPFGRRKTHRIALADPRPSPRTKQRRAKRKNDRRPTARAETGLRQQLPRQVPSVPKPRRDGSPYRRCRISKFRCSFTRMV